MTWRMAQCIAYICIILILHSSASNLRLAIWGVLWIENLVERHFEFQNVDVKILSVSMKSESKDRSFLIWIDVAFMHINLFAVLQESLLVLAEPYLCTQHALTDITPGAILPD